MLSFIRNRVSSNSAAWAPLTLSPHHTVSCAGASVSGPALPRPRPRPAGGGGPEPHLAAHAAVPRDEGAGDVHRAALARAEGGGAGAGAGRQVVEDAHMEIGMVGLEHVAGRLLMWRAVVRKIPFFHRIQKWIKKWIIEWIMVSEEISEQIKRVGGMEVAVSV